jgi:hypothetical protein
MTTIKPSVGRVVWYRPGQYDFVLHTRWNEGTSRKEVGPLAAIITGVVNDHCVHLAGFDFYGYAWSRQNVYLWHGDCGVEQDSPYAEWMPYQKGQAAKTDAAEGDLRGRVAALENILAGVFAAMNTPATPRMVVEPMEGAPAKLDMPDAAFNR